jgi:hypothetical protein
VPQNTSPPTISGNEHEGDTLTAVTGAWDTTPTKFVYQRQRCGSSGSGCADISGATEKTSTLTGSDVDHTVRVTVTEELSANAGTWTGGVRSYAYQWQRCEVGGRARGPSRPAR